MKILKLILSILTAGLLLTACRSKEEVAFSMEPVENVEALWQIIDTKYCYIDTKGIDWSAIHEEYIEKAKALDKNDQVALFDVCAAMLDSLRDGHVNLYTAFDRSANTAWYDTFPANYDSKLQALYLRDYRVAAGLYYCTIDNGRIGYIYYPSFSTGFSSANIAWVFTAFKDCKGLVIDVRNNGGGAITNAYQLAAPFFEADQTIGYWQHKTGPGHEDFSEPEPMKLDASLIQSKWGRSVVILCNRRSYSATNLFVSMMRYAKNATLVGGVSGGGGGMPMSYEMPCGWTVRFSSVRMYDRDRKDIEAGIMPDILVTQHSTDKDDLIEKAIEVINKQ
jgi:hypothetical protein